MKNWFSNCTLYMSLLRLLLSYTFSFSFSFLFLSETFQTGWSIFSSVTCRYGWVIMWHSCDPSCYSSRLIRWLIRWLLTWLIIWLIRWLNHMTHHMTHQATQLHDASHDSSGDSSGASGRLQLCATASSKCLIHIRLTKLNLLNHVCKIPLYW